MKARERELWWAYFPPPQNSDSICLCAAGSPSLCNWSKSPHSCLRLGLTCALDLPLRPCSRPVLPLPGPLASPGLLWSIETYCSTLYPNPGSHSGCRLLLFSPPEQNSFKELSVCYLHFCTCGSLFNRLPPGSSFISTHGPHWTFCFFLPEAPFT